MSRATERAYWAWRRAADKSYDGNRAVHYTTLIRRERRISGLKARYEALLARDKAGPRRAS